MARIIKNRYGMWERTRFNKLKENDWFTFRTRANITDVYSDDVLFKVDCEFSTEDSCKKVNCMSCGGAQFLIRNKRSIVWKVLIDEIERCLL